MRWIRWLTIALLTFIFTIGSQSGWLTPALGQSPLSGVKQLRGTGQFRLVYGTAKTPFYQELQRGFEQSGGMEQTVASLNGLNLALPTDIAVTFIECGEENAFYSSRDRLIIICYDFMIAEVNQFMQPPINKSEIL